MSCVDSVSRLPVDNSTALNPQKVPSFAAELQAAQVKVSQSQTADITIVTAEGDTVTLSSNKSAELSFATYDAQGQVNGSSAHLSGMSMELHRTSDFSISVDGDLNKDELKDIRRAIRTIQKAANDVLKGHEDKAAARTAKLARLDQIASIDADMEFNREVTVTRISAQSQAAAIPESTETPATPDPVSDPAQPTSEAPAPPSPATATATTATASTHVSVLIQTQAAAPANSPEASKSGLWWFPSPDLWNVLYPKQGSLTPAVSSPDSATAVTA